MALLQHELLRPPSSGRRDEGAPLPLFLRRLPVRESGAHAPVSVYVSAPGVEPVRIRVLRHRPRHPAPYIPAADRYPGPGARTMPSTLTDDLTYADFLLLLPAPVGNVSATSQPL